ncbi:MAG: hypothetical protein ACLP29_12605 [Dissulfurispiraceae bacterium]
MCGWTTAGDRSEFKLVTGISTGVFISPFVLLGSAYEAQLKEFYTTISKKGHTTETRHAGGRWNQNEDGAVPSKILTAAIFVTY